MIEYKRIRQQAASEDQLFRVEIDGFPYLPNLDAQPDDVTSVKEVVLHLFHLKGLSNGSSDLESLLSITIVRGGNTNALFCVRGLSSLREDIDDKENDALPDPVLVRIFGAPGLIDRDEETLVYTALSRQGFAPKYYGRFGNGRIEQFLEGARPLETMELSKSSFSNQIAEQLGRLHNQFQLPEELRSTAPNMWSQLEDWLSQSMEQLKHLDQLDEEIVKARLPSLSVDSLANEVARHKESLSKVNCTVTFCHNDLLAANSMVDSSDGGSMKFIDFEYGGVNYAVFDIANHFNEFAGGTDTGTPNYELFPARDVQRDFCTSYLRGFLSVAEPSSTQVAELMEQVDSFVMVNHLYWGCWALNLGTKDDWVLEEGEFDYMLYASCRITEYWHHRRK